MPSNRREDTDESSITQLNEFDSGAVTVEADDVEHATVLFENDPPRTYRHGRCRAIVMGSRQRCPEPVSTAAHADGVCEYHADHDPYRIDADPERLIAVTGRVRLHLADIDPESVDFDLDLIRSAVAAVESEPSRDRSQPSARAGEMGARS